MNIKKGDKIKLQKNINDAYNETYYEAGEIVTVVRIKDGKPVIGNGFVLGKEAYTFYSKRNCCPECGRK